MKSIYCIKEWIVKEKPLRHSVYCKLNVLRKFTVRKQILERFFLTLLVRKNYFPLGISGNKLCK